MTRPTLLFGLGATRAGTTWLWRYLSDHPQTAMPREKELHYFDALDLGGAGWQRTRLTAQIARIKLRLEREPEAANTPNLEAWLHDLTRLRDLITRRAPVEEYLDFLRAGRAGDLHADLTPAYALLSEARLSEMATLTSRTRFIYLMRDPVARLWSNICQVVKRRSVDPSEMDRLAARLLRRALNGQEPDLMARSDYRSALMRFSRAFDPSQLFVGYYEDLFRPETTARICGFLGLDPHPANFSRITNASPGLLMRDAQRQRMRAALAPQYAFVADRFGGLPEGWMQEVSA